MKLIIPGNPIPQKRHRHCLRGKHIHLYDPAIEDKEMVRRQIMNQLLHMGFPIISACSPCTTYPIINSGEDIGISINFDMQMPLSWSKKKKDSFPAHLSKPDIDNLAKFYLDCMSTLIFHDDKQITELHLSKYYSDDPKTTIFINRFGDV